MIEINTRDAVPIWKQIEDEVRRLVAVGAYPPGNPVPSVRELAQRLRINPATAAKAYQRLTDEGILSVRRGEGTFVADEPPVPSKKERRQALTAAARRYVASAESAGAGEEDAVGAVRGAFRETIPQRSRG